MNKDIPDFSPGDTVVVQVKVKEGSRERLQAFEGVVIAKRNRGLNSSFTVRKISHGEGVERVFQQLFHHRSRPFDDFSCSNLIYQMKQKKNVKV